MSQRRVIQGFMPGLANGFREDDVMMISLPLYHSSALLVGVSSVIITGEKN